MKIKKMLGREMSVFEILTVLLGILVAVYSILKGNGNLVPTFFGIGLLILIGIFIKNKRKDIILLGMISVLGGLLILNIASPLFLTTTFSPGFNSIPPSTLEECQEIGGVAIPITGECSVYMVETKGNAGEGYICCLPDTCQGEWVRVWNSETKIYEKICNE